MSKSFIGDMIEFTMVLGMLLGAVLLLIFVTALGTTVHGVFLFGLFLIIPYMALCSRIIDRM